MEDYAVKDLLSELEGRLPAALEFLQRMVELESPSFDKALVDQLGDYVSDEFAKLGPMLLG